MIDMKCAMRTYIVCNPAAVIDNGDRGTLIPVIGETCNEKVRNISRVCL